MLNTCRLMCSFLVHGRVFKDPVWLDFRRIHHAWIELPNGNRYDAVLDEMFTPARRPKID
jgi:hypothetical protein